MRLRIFALLLCLLPGLRATEVEDLVQQALAAEIRQDSAGALQLLLQADKLRPDNALILQKIARQYSDLVVEQNDLAEKRRFAQTALEYSERAVALNPKDPVNILSLAVCHGKLALSSDTRDKVRYSRLVKDEAEKALALDPNYAWAHHVLGRWHCEVATLGATSRFLVKVFYGDLQNASITEGINHLRRATELDPKELNHWLELGFAYFSAGQKPQAREQWTRGLEMPSRGIHDEPAKQRAREQLAKLD